MMMGSCWNGFGWGGWGSTGFVSPILYLVFFVGALALLGLGTTWLVRQLRQSTVSRIASDPLEIARLRLAAGEITIAEFEEIRGRLES
jgi:uncharacterized membrane protein